MKFESQKVAREYFIAAVLLFLLQVVFGLLSSVKYIWHPDPLLYILPFNIARAIHINLLVFYLLLALMGASYYMVSDETGTELYSVRLARIQLGTLLVSGVTAIVGYVFNWSFGMPFLEQPTVIKLAITVAAVMFLVNIGVTIVKARHWTGISGTLLAGMVMLSVMFLFGIPFLRNLSVQYFFWWWVIHLWVEGAWELIAAAIMAWALIKLTGVPRNIVERWLFVEIGLVLVTGILGTGHHYYWIGTPHYWLWWGGIFSAMQPLPILLMLFDTLRHISEGQQPVKNRLAMGWLGTSAFVHFVGAGVWGFGQTLPQINRWTHGTQITASHGHFAFWGAYGMLAIALIYLILPEITRRPLEKTGKVGITAFACMNFGMIFMVIALLIAGIVQVYLQRVVGMDFLEAQNYVRLWLSVRLVTGLIFAVGTGFFVWHFFALNRSPAPPARA
jgi:nitric oxide reductase subunit B